MCGNLVKINRLIYQVSLERKGKKEEYSLMVLGANRIRQRWSGRCVKLNLEELEVR